MTYDELHAIVFPSVGPNLWATKIKRLDRRGVVLKHGYNGGRRAVVCVEGSYYILLEGSYCKVSILPVINYPEELQQNLDVIKLFSPNAGGYIKLNKQFKLTEGE